MAATFMKVKGIPYWIEAIKNVKTNKEVHFVLFGSKTNSAPAQKMIENHPQKQNIHLLGMRNDALSLIKGLDMYTQTSISEGFGRAVSEALILGKPIVMTNAGGCTELIDESCGIVVPVKDAKAIAKAWSLLINDDQLRKNMSIAATQKIHKDFHFDHMVTDTISLYQKLVKNA